MYLYDEFGSSHGVVFSDGHTVLPTEGSHFMLLFTDVGIFNLGCVLYYGCFNVMFCKVPMWVCVCFVMCGCNDNCVGILVKMCTVFKMCTGIYCVLYCLYCVFVLFRLCVLSVLG